MKGIHRWSAHLCVSGLLLGSAWAAGAATHEVEMRNTAFNPANLTIPQGDTVRWTQRDFLAHTSTSGEAPIPDGLWDSGNLTAVGQTFSFTFVSAGVYPYFCIPHSFSMTGTVTVQAVANNPPTVQITSPTNNASFTAPANVTISADADDADGSVAQVEFFDGAVSLGTDAIAPYEVTAELGVGSHQLTAVATDDDGDSTTSTSVTITVGTTPITNPIPEKIAKGAVTIELQTVVDGLASPLGLVLPDDGSGRMFIYDQSGLVWVLANGAKLPVPMLDVRSRMVILGTYDERGLLGMAAHPDFANNPLLYTYTSEPVSGPADFTVTFPPEGTTNHQSVVAEWQIDLANPNVVDVASRRELMRIDQPQSNHNGGTLRFDADGHLLIAFGDGGAADDQGNGHGDTGNGQNIETIHGSLVRIDVDGNNSANGQYGVPADNPFVGATGVDEIFAYGFRNPFMFSVDSLTGDILLGDVGQNALEEVDVVVNGGNYGWNVKEGTFYFDPNGAGAGYVTDVPVVPVPPDLIDPIAQYDHDEGLAIVGGYIYRGSALPALSGRYVTGDWGSFASPSGRLFYLDEANEVTELVIGAEDRALGEWVKGFGEDASGELYVFTSRALGPYGNTGRMRKLVPAPAGIHLTSLETQPGGANLEWTGGVGPVAVQRKSVFSEQTWVNDAFCGGQTGSVMQVASTGFYRVADAATLPAMPMTVYMSGGLERPNPVTTTGTGSGTLILEGRSLTFDIAYSGLSGPATAAHIHGPAPASAPAGVMVDLAPYHENEGGPSGRLSGTIVLSSDQAAAVMAGHTYVNVHTVANGGGEIRGQIAPVMMQAEILGSHERPNPVNSPATGLGLFLLEGNQLTFNVTYRDLSGSAIAAHLHGPADATAPAGVLIDLAPHHDGIFAAAGSFTGTLTLTDAQLGAVVDGRTYVNIHTTANSGGEIRGQVVPQLTAIPFSSFMSGAMERPTPLVNNGNGSGTFSLEGNVLRFVVRYDDLTGTATAAHIHGPAPASAPAGVLINLAPYNGGGFGSAGTISGQIVLSPEHLAAVLAGQTYVNIHTVANSGGEIRGQIAPVLRRIALSGSTARPAAIATPGTGSGAFTLVRDRLRMNVTYRELTGTADNAHIHGPATTSQTAGVLVDLAPYNGGGFGTAGSFYGTLTLSPANLAHLMDAMTYINIHTPINGGGEIRGQVTP